MSWLPAFMRSTRYEPRLPTPIQPTRTLSLAPNTGRMAGAATIAALAEALMKPRRDTSSCIVLRISDGDGDRGTLDSVFPTITPHFDHQVPDNGGVYREHPYLGDADALYQFVDLERKQRGRGDDGEILSPALVKQQADHF